MNDIVKYDNDMNTIQFNKFKDKELDLFFAICHKMKMKGLDEVELNFSELRELSNYSNTKKAPFIKDLKSTYDKLIQLNFEIKEDDLNFIKFVLFTKYEVSGKKETVSIKVNEEFKYILNELGTTYTKFELQQFTSLRSTYSKTLFKLLKQWEGGGKEKKFKLEEFRKLLNIPDSYNFSKINVKILSHISKELPPFFPDFKIEKIKKGRKITELKFSWAAQNMKQAKLIKIEIVISEKLEKTIEKTKKNKFVNPILTKENIKKLLEIFDEKILINAFSKAYIEIKKEINFNYLKTFIENTLKQQEIKFTVVKEAEHIEPIEEKTEDLKTETRKPKEKIKVTDKEKKRKYEEYLKVNNLQDNKFNKKSFEVTFNTNFELIKNKEIKEKTSKPKIKEVKIRNDNQYLKELKTIEFDLIISNDERYEEFKNKLLQYERLNSLLNESIQFLSDDKVSKIKITIDDLREYFSTFESRGIKTIDFEEIDKEKLLSKKGKILFGGALVSRLEKIAREEKIKIKY